MENKENTFKKYKWLYLIVTAAVLAVLAVLMFVIKEFREKTALYFTCAIMIAFVVIRIIPLLKTSKNGYAMLINVLEMLLDLGAAIFMLVVAIRYDNSEFLRKFYPFIIGGVVYLRGFIYLVEVTFLNTKVQKALFFGHIGLITLGSVIMALYDKFDLATVGLILAVVIALCSLAGAIDGGISYNNFRKEYILPKKALKEMQKELEKKQKEEQEKQIDDHQEEIPEVIIPNEDNKQDQDYIS